MPNPVLQDTFTEAANTNLQAHTADSGATYTEHPVAAALGNLQVLATGDFLRCNSNFFACCYASVVPATPQQQIYAEVTVVTQLGYLGVMTRLDVTALTCYFMMVIGSHPTESQGYIIGKIVSGTVTTLDTLATTPATGDKMQLVVSGPSILGYVNGVLVLDAVDTDIVAVGRYGVFGHAQVGAPATTVGLRLDNLLGEDITGGLLPVLGDPIRTFMPLVVR